MQQLKKPTKKKNCLHKERFNEVCRAIREALHLEHWRCSYRFSADTGSNARSHMTNLGNRRVWIEICDPFWDKDGEEQLSSLIHEHIHSLLDPYDQAMQELKEKYVHIADAQTVETLRYQAGETVTDHLEAVIYELIEHRF